MGWFTLPNLYLTMFFAGLGITALMLVLGLGHEFLGHFDFGDHDLSGGHDVGVDHDASADHDAAGHEGGHFDFLHWLSTLFSPLMLSVFLTVFGGVGYLACQTPVLNFPAINIPLAAAAGLFAVFGLLLPFPEMASADGEFKPPDHSRPCWFDWREFVTDSAQRDWLNRLCLQRHPTHCSCPQPIRQANPSRHACANHRRCG
jgi:hypothetical protein